MLITITKFAEERGERPDTIHKYLMRHPEIEVQKSGREKALDTEKEAYKILDEQYPLPKPVEVVHDIESEKRLQQAQGLIIELQQSLLASKEENYNLKALKLEEEFEKKKLLLEVKDFEDLKAKYEKKEEELKQVSDELSRVNNRNFIERLLNK